MVVAQHIEIDNLKLLVLKLQRMQFGRKSEKLDRQIEQLELRLEDLEAAPHSPPSAAAAPAAEPTPIKPARRPLPESLPRHEDAPAEAPGLPRLRWQSASARRRRFRDAGVRAGAFRSDPGGAPEAELLGLRAHRASAGAEPTHRPRSARAGPAGPRAGGQVRRPPPALPAIGDLRARRHRTGSLDAGRLGRRRQRRPGTAGRATEAVRHEHRQAARRRYAGPGAGAGERQNQNRAPVDLRAGRSSGWRRCGAGGMVRLLAESQGRASGTALERFSRHAAGRRLCRFQPRV